MWGCNQNWLLLLVPPQGKSFVKDALRCMALGLRQRFSCVSRRCSAVREMVFSLQRECYSKHQLCLALRDHMDTMGSLVQFHLMFPPGWETHAHKSSWKTWKRDARCITAWYREAYITGYCPIMKLNGFDNLKPLKSAVCTFKVGFRAANKHKEEEFFL